MWFAHLSSSGVADQINYIHNWTAYQPVCITIVTCNGKDVAISNDLYTVNHSYREHQLYNNCVVLNVSKY